MARPIESNSYRVEGDITFIDVSTKTHPNTWTLIDTDMLGTVLDGQGRWRMMDGYVVRYVQQLRQRLSRVILGNPPGLVDHKDRNTLDNRRENLRVATSTINIVNRKALNVYGHKGVQRLRSGRFLARITAQGISKTIGTFDTAEEAGIAYRQAVEAVHDIVLLP